jgi:hypothetical protein
MRQVMNAALLVGLAALTTCTRPAEHAALYGQIREVAGPVEAAQVFILDASGTRVLHRILSGSGGKFTLRRALAPGTYVLEVRHRGYQTLRRTLDFPVAAPLELELLPHIQVRGHVRLPDGRPASRALVAFRGPAGARVEVTAGEAGSYSVRDLDPGEYEVEALTPDRAFRYTGRHVLAGDPRDVGLDLVLERSNDAAGD